MEIFITVELVPNLSLCQMSVVYGNPCQAFTSIFLSNQKLFECVSESNSIATEL